MPSLDLQPAPLVVRRAKSLVRPIPARQARRVFWALAFASVACVCMVVAGKLYIGPGPRFYYLIWNLMLAWIPLGFSFAAYRTYSSETRRNILFMACALAWFLFFPNAPYITTDAVHIHDDQISASWFHLLCIMSCAWTGLSLGYVSLYLMQEVVRARCGAAVAWVFVMFMLGAGAVGIYAGRFLRWNSWDVLRHPVGYLRMGYHEVLPFDDPGKASFIVLMFLFLVLSYGILHALTHLHEPVSLDR